MRSNSQYSENMEYLRSYEAKLQIARKYERFEIILGPMPNIPKIVRRSDRAIDILNSASRSFEVISGRRMVKLRSFSREFIKKVNVVVIKCRKCRKKEAFDQM